MIRRGVTLIELLLAIAILLAMSAILLPVAWTGFDSRRFDATGESIERQLMLARAHAQRTGEAIEVTYIPDRGAVVARSLRAIDDRPTIREPGASALAGDRDPAGGLPGGNAEPAVLPDAWAVLRLPNRMHLQAADPNGQREASVDERAHFQIPGAAIANREDANAPVRLVIFVPDGSGLLATPVWLVDEAGRRGRLSVASWSGTARYERLPDREDEVIEPVFGPGRVGQGALE